MRSRIRPIPLRFVRTLLPTLLLACASEPEAPTQDLFQDLTATVIVVDAAGREHPFTSGLATFRVHDRWGVTAKQVQVRAGRLNLRIPTGSRIELRELILDDQNAHVENTQISITPDNTFHLRGRWK